MSGENGACPPTKSGQSTHFWAENRLEIGLKNGAYPFNIAENAENHSKKRSIAVHLLWERYDEYRNHTENGALPFT